MDGVPADAHAPDPGRVGGSQALVVWNASDALASAASDAAELLDVDMDQLARPLALVALDGFQAETAELAHPDPLQDPADRRDRQAQQLRELRGP
jgi:hypothetical protein